MNSENQTNCQCATWRDRVRISLGATTADLLITGFDFLRDRNPWVHLARCTECEQPWYVAVDTVDDDYYFRRVSPTELAGILERDEWPTDYDEFVNVWPLEDGQNFRARLHWPWKDDEFEAR